MVDVSDLVGEIVLVCLLLWMNGCCKVVVVVMGIEEVSFGLGDVFVVVFVIVFLFGLFLCMMGDVLFYVLEFVVEVVFVVWLR